MVVIERLELLDHFKFVFAGVEVAGDGVTRGQEAPALLGASCAEVLFVHIESQLITLGACPIFDDR